MEKVITFDLDTLSSLFFVSRMRYVAAYLLAVLGGNKNPSKDDLEKILGAVGLEVDEERIEKVNKYF